MNSFQKRKLLWAGNILFGMLVIALSIFALRTKHNTITEIQFTMTEKPSENAGAAKKAYVLPTMRTLNKLFGPPPPRKTATVKRETKKKEPLNTIVQKPVEQDPEKILQLKLVGVITPVAFLRDMTEGGSIKYCKEGTPIYRSVGNVSGKLAFLKRVYTDHVIITYRKMDYTLKMNYDSDASTTLANAKKAVFKPKVPSRLPGPSRPKKTVQTGHSTGISRAVSRKKRPVKRERIKLGSHDVTLNKREDNTYTMSTADTRKLRENIDNFMDITKYNVHFNEDGILLKDIYDPTIKSFALKAGLKPGDKIVSVAGKPVGNFSITSAYSLYSELNKKTSVNVVIERNGKKQTVTYALEK